MFIPLEDLLNIIWDTRLLDHVTIAVISDLYLVVKLIRDFSIFLWNGKVGILMMIVGAFLFWAISGIVKKEVRKAKETE